MGECFITLYREKLKRSWKIAFYGTFLACLFIHIYKFTNTLPNHDSFYSVYFDQDMTISGRWFLQYACGISSYFDLPWINGLLSAFYLGITAALVAELFDLENPVVIVLSGVVLAACPSTTETFFFEFTADGYLMGLMISALAACLSCKGTHVWHYCLSGVCLCLSCAIYQAYISFAIVLCICYLVNRLLNDEITVRDAWKWIGKHVLIYAAAMIAYYGLWKLILAVTRQTATDYQGINQVGISVSTLVSGAVKSVKNILFFYLEWNILEHPITLYAVLNIVFLLALAAIVAVAVAKSGIHRKASRLLMVLFCLAAAVPMISIWCFLSGGVVYRPMMLHSICVFYIFALILFDKRVGAKISTLFGLLMAVMVFNFAIMANISYFYLDKCYEKSYYLGSQMMEDIEEMQQESGEEIERIAFIGSRVEDVAISEIMPGSRIHILSILLETDFLYDHTHTYLYLKGVFDLGIDGASTQYRKELERNTDVQNMEVWPVDNSITVIDNTLVVKLAENQK